MQLNLHLIAARFAGAMMYFRFVPHQSSKELVVIG
jgi:hypothetical protein